MACGPYTHSRKPDNVPLDQDNSYVFPLLAQTNIFPSIWLAESIAVQYVVMLWLAYLSLCPQNTWESNIKLQTSFSFFSKNFLLSKGLCANPLYYLSYLTCWGSYNDLQYCNLCTLLHHYTTPIFMHFYFYQICFQK